MWQITPFDCVRNAIYRTEIDPQTGERKLIRVILSEELATSVKALEFGSQRYRRKSESKDS